MWGVCRLIQLSHINNTVWKGLFFPSIVCRRIYPQQCQENAVPESMGRLHISAVAQLYREITAEISSSGVLESFSADLLTYKRGKLVEGFIFATIYVLLILSIFYSQAAETVDVKNEPQAWISRLMGIATSVAIIWRSASRTARLTALPI